MNSTSGNTFWKLATVARRPANLPDKTFGAPGKTIINKLVFKKLT